ncbi:MAG TPA: septum formation initiator family protein [Longimicrobiales bacterium]|nr:septum formation initiator family protein [Longimicrobiales bacterium]
MRLPVLLGGVLLAGAGYFAIFGGDYDVFEVHRIRADRAAEELRAAETRDEVQRLRARRDSLLHDSATIERVARERYGMIRDGERLYRFAEPPADEPPATGVGDGPGAAEAAETEAGARPLPPGNDPRRN